MLSGRDDVGADVAEGLERAVRPLRRDEAAEVAPGDVLEEHALDRVAAAELQHLVVGWLDQLHGA